MTSENTSNAPQDWANAFKYRKPESGPRDGGHQAIQTYPAGHQLEAMGPAGRKNQTAAHWSRALKFTTYNKKKAAVEENFKHGL